MRKPERREIGCLFTERGQRVQVVVNRGDVEVRGIVLSQADRDAFARVYFLACADADDWLSANQGDGTT